MAKPWRVFALLVILSACNSRQDPATSAQKNTSVGSDSGQWFRAAVYPADLEVPFFLWVPQAALGASAECKIWSARELESFPCTQNGKDFSAAFRLWPSTIHAEVGAKGELVGTWTSSMYRKSGPVRFVARPVEKRDAAALLAATPNKHEATDGSWALSGSSQRKAKLTLVTDADGLVNASLWFEGDGDMLLAGGWNGRSLLLWSFDGFKAIRIELQLDDTAPPQMRGRGGSVGAIWQEEFVATKMATYDDSRLITIKVKPGITKLKLLPEIPASYHGKPLVLEYFATWCAMCNDLTQVLHDLHRRFSPKGLAVISICLEGTPDKAYVDEQVKRYRELYQVPWKVIPYYIEFDEIAELLPEELDNANSVPLTIFLYPDQTIRSVHSGFFSTANPEARAKMLQEFEESAAAITSRPGEKMTTP